MRPESGFRIAPNCPKIIKMAMTAKFAKLRHRHFFEVVLFLLSSLVTGTSFMPIASLFWSYDNLFL